jgi:hypothetical protein
MQYILALVPLQIQDPAQNQPLSQPHPMSPPCQIQELLMDDEDQHKRSDYWSDVRLYQIILKKERGEKLTDYEQMVLAFEYGKSSCNHPH